MGFLNPDRIREKLDNICNNNRSLNKLIFINVSLLFVQIDCSKLHKIYISKCYTSVYKECK